MVEGSNPPSININVYFFFTVFFFIGFLFETQVYENRYSQLLSIRGAKFLIHPAVFLKLIFITEKNE